MPLKWTALAVSCLLGLLVLVTAAVPIWQRAIFYVLNTNTLIIFSVGIGTNSIGHGSGQALGEANLPTRIAYFEFVGPAFAQGQPNPKSDAPGRVIARGQADPPVDEQKRQAELDALRRQQEDVRRKIEELQRKPNVLWPLVLRL